MAAATIVAAGVSVAVTLVLWGPLDLTAYAVGNLIGPIAGLVLIVGRLARLSMLPTPRLMTQVAGLRAWFGHALPLTVSAAVLQLNPIVNTAIASLLSEGAVSSMRFANLLVAVPIGAISLAWGRAIYPQLVKTTLDGDGSRLGVVTDYGTRFVIAAFVPISILTMAVAPLAVSVAFGRGEFSPEDVGDTALALVGFAPTIVFGMLIPVLSGALNARRKGAVVLAGGILNVTLNLVLSALLGLTFGIFGVALATSITLAVIVLFFANRVHAIEPTFDSLTWIRVFVRAAVMATPGALLAAWIAWTFWPDLGTLSGLVLLVAIGVVGLTVYFVVARVVGSREQVVIMTTARKALRRGARA
jgi:putative peptidoglycan lipid II flippase